MAGVGDRTCSLHDEQDRCGRWGVLLRRRLRDEDLLFRDGPERGADGMERRLLFGRLLDHVLPAREMPGPRGRQELLSLLLLVGRGLSIGLRLRQVPLGLLARLPQELVLRQHADLQPVQRQLRTTQQDHPGRWRLHLRCQLHHGDLFSRHRQQRQRDRVDRRLLFRGLRKRILPAREMPGPGGRQELLSLLLLVGRGLSIGLRLRQVPLGLLARLPQELVLRQHPDLQPVQRQLRVACRRIHRKTRAGPKGFCTCPPVAPLRP